MQWEGHLTATNPLPSLDGFCILVECLDVLPLSHPAQISLNRGVEKCLHEFLVG